MQAVLRRNLNRRISTAIRKIQPQQKNVRVRFAPSPTGSLHLGGLRTALFNYLLAKRNGGAFILRIEDTDKAREVPGTADEMLRILQWAGIAPDEGYGVGGPCAPYVQSQRSEHYYEASEQLIKAGFAYRCFLTPEELDRLRVEETAAHGGLIFKRSKFRSQLADAAASSNREFTVRLDTDRVASVVDASMPSNSDDGDDGYSTDVVVHDLLCGLVRTPSSQVVIRL